MSSRGVDYPCPSIPGELSPGTSDESTTYSNDLRKRKTVGSDHEEVAESLNSLAMTYYKKRQLDDALPLLQEALSIQEKKLDPDDPAIARTLYNLGAIAIRKHEYQRCRELWEQALSIREKALGPDHPDVARTLGNAPEISSRLA